MPTLSEAKRIMKGAIVKAQELDVNISVAVCDVRGQLIALNRMDGASWNVGRKSIGKAIAAAITGCPSEELAKQLMASGRQAASNKVVTSRRATRWSTYHPGRRC